MRSKTRAKLNEQKMEGNENIIEEKQSHETSINYGINRRKIYYDDVMLTMNQEWNTIDINEFILKKRSFKTIKSKYKITLKAITHKQKQTHEIFL